MLRHSLAVIFMVASVSTITLWGDQGAENATDREVKQAETAVAHLEEEWLKALNQADVNSIAEILADDFVRPAPESGQFVNKADHPEAFIYRRICEACGSMAGDIGPGKCCDPAPGRSSLRCSKARL
jgi:hypothetical protein